MPMRHISEALCLAAAAVLFAATTSAQSQAAAQTQASGQGAVAADRSSVRVPKATRPARRTQMTPARTWRAGR